MNDLMIKWDTLDCINGSGSRGEMRINFEFFFPAPTNELKKLFKVIQKDCEWSSIEQNVELMLNYLNSAIPETKAAAKQCANDHVTVKTELEELKRCIKAKKKVNGVPVTKEELEQMRKKQKELQTQVSGTRSEFTRLSSKLKRLQANLLTVQQFKESRW